MKSINARHTQKVTSFRTAVGRVSKGYERAHKNDQAAKNASVSGPIPPLRARSAHANEFAHALKMSCQKNAHARE